MNEERNRIAAETEGTRLPRPARNRRWITAGFVTGAALWLATFVPFPGYGVIAVLIFDCYVLPFVAGLLALIPPTRRFGLGLLLASGLGWLVLGAICGAEYLAR